MCVSPYSVINYNQLRYIVYYTAGRVLRSTSVYILFWISFQFEGHEVEEAIVWRIRVLIITTLSGLPVGNSRGTVDYRYRSKVNGLNCEISVSFQLVVN